LRRGLIISLSLGLVFFLSLAVMHEGTHKQLAELYGCDAEVNYLPDFERGYFMSTYWECSDISDANLRDLKMLQGQTEIVGYLGIIAATPILVMLSLILVSLEQQRSMQEREIRQQILVNSDVDGELGQ